MVWESDWRESQPGGEAGGMTIHCAYVKGSTAECQKDRQS